MTDYAKQTSTHKTLTANSADLVTLTHNPRFKYVEVVNRSSADTIYFTVNDAVPVVAGDNTYVVAAGSGLVVESAMDPDKVRLISAGPAPYSVTGIVS